MLSINKIILALHHDIVDQINRKQVGDISLEEYHMLYDLEDKNII